MNLDMKGGFSSDGMNVIYSTDETTVMMLVPALLEQVARILDFPNLVGWCAVTFQHN